MAQCCPDTGMSKNFTNEEIEMQKQCYSDACVSQCYGEKKGVVDREGSVISEAFVQQVLQLYTDESIKNVVRTVAPKCVEHCNAHSKALRAKDPNTYSCSPAMTLVNLCTYVEIETNCPSEIRISRSLEQMIADHQHVLQVLGEHYQIQSLRAKRSKDKEFEHETCCGTGQHALTNAETNAIEKCNHHLHDGCSATGDVNKAAMEEELKRHYPEPEVKDLIIIMENVMCPKKFQVQSNECEALRKEFKDMMEKNS
ncbi:hypothetical protein C0J52_17914 [Blattella germanica]|nr:hypothetical protein C0J52_17914 [Blattella germanica]